MEPVAPPSVVSTPRRWSMKPLSPHLELSELRSMVSPVSPASESAFTFTPDSAWGAPSPDSSAFEGISVTRTHSSISVTTAAPGDGQEDVVVMSRQVGVGSEAERGGEAWSAGSSAPSTPSTTPGTPTSSVGSHTGFYSFVDDPTSPEAERNEEWMTSPERQATLATLKTESSYTLQTYAPGLRPERLFEENNGDARYRVDSTLVSRAVAQEEDEVVALDRKEIIREQAPRKSGALKEQRAALDTLDLSAAQQRFVDGLSICYGPANPAAEPTPAEPGTIDEQQIDFKSARKQFLMMERSGASPVIRRAADAAAAPSTAPPSTTHPPPPTSYTPHASLQPHAAQVPAEMRRYMFAEGSGAALDVVSKESRSSDPHAGRSQSQSSQLSSEDDVFVSNAVTVRVTEEPDGKRSAVAELDSGLGDQTAEDASDRSSSSSSPAPDAAQEETAAEREARIARETPIEREIRVAQEREESLRRVRGIRHSSVAEMVEIKTKPLLALPTPDAPARPLKAKESSRVSFLLQREISREIRERSDSSGAQAVGTATGQGPLYDVEERRRVFEQAAPVKPSPTPPVTSSPAHKQLDASQSSPGARDDGRAALTEISEQTEKEDEEGQSCCPHRHADHTVLPVSRVTSSYAGSDRSWSSRTRVRVSVAPSTDHQGASSPASLLPRTSGVLRASTRSFSSSSLTDTHATHPPAWKRHLDQCDLEKTHLEQGDLEKTHDFEKTPLEQQRDLEKTHLQQQRDLEQREEERRELEKRLQNAPDLIREEIERDLRREREHLALRESRGRSVSLDTGLDDVEGAEQVVTTTTAMTTKTSAAEAPGLQQSSEEKNTTWQPSGTETAEPPKEPALPEEPVKPAGSRSSYSWSVDTHPTRRMASTDKALHTPSPRPYARLPSISMTTAQPWGSQKPVSVTTAQPWGSQKAVSVTTARVSPLVLGGSGPLERVRSTDALAPPLTPSSPRGLTETLLEGFEEHRAKLKMEENAYAGIQASDDVNHEVLESTRVTRHKNRMALRWEAGVYANEDDK